MRFWVLLLSSFTVHLCQGFALVLMGFLSN